jgi:hypothetical protein
VIQEHEEACEEEEWVGRVQHIPSGIEARFSGTQELLAFINMVHAEHTISIERAPKSA